MSEATITPVEHPLLDFGGEGFAATETRTPVVFLSPGRVSLLAAAQAAGKRAVLVTDELSMLTPALATVWREAGAGWVVRSRSGLREGFTGRRLASVGDLLTAAPVQDVDDVDLGFLRPTPADAVQVSVVVSLRHRARAGTLLGGPTEAMAELVSGRPPRVWGPHEPAGQRWDRAELTEFARSQMPGPVLMLGSGEGFVTSIQVQRTDVGLEEITEAQVSLGVPSTLDFADQRRRLVTWLADLTATAMPLVGLVLARPGRADLLVPPVLTHPPTPLALLIGPPGVRAMGIDVADLVRRFDALQVGRPRIPGILFSLGTLGDPGWQRLDEVLEAIGRDKIAEVTGLSERHLTRPAEGGTDGE
jgi:Family of unknown function (DUF6177)